MSRKYTMGLVSWKEGSVVSSCGSDNEQSGSIKGDKFPRKIEIQFIKKDY
jgi:hypothetical protein